MVANLCEDSSCRFDYDVDSWCDETLKNRFYKELTEEKHTFKPRLYGGICYLASSNAA